MKKSIFTIALLMVGIAATKDHKILNKYISKEKTEKIKASTKSWVPFETENHPWRELTDDQIKSKFGLIMPDQTGGLFGMIHSLFRPVESVGFRHKRVQTKPPLGLPTSFDARTQWPNCIHDIRDQGYCGSCWAFSSAGFLEDRFCIASNEAINVRLAPQDMVNCATQCLGCNGGYLSVVTNYLITDGAVSEDCMPYSSGDSGANGFCNFRCTAVTETFKKYKCKKRSAVYPTSATDIMTELYNNGPMQVGFYVYSDFIDYTSGIYEVTSDATLEGGHAVKLIGWNYSGSDLYWIMQNQWGTSWGESGYFNIYAGQAGIDSVAFACTPDV